MPLMVKSIESFADLLSARPLKQWVCEIEDADGTTLKVRFRELTASGLSMFFDFGKGGAVAFTAKEMVAFVAQTLCNSAGELVATPEQLEGYSSELVQKMYVSAMDCMGYTKSNLDEKKTA